MITKVQERIRRYLTMRSVLAVLIFVALAHLGMYFQSALAALVDSLSLPGSVLIIDVESIYGLWVGLLGVHAAVGAVAPILGYTLMATTITAASRIAPSGAVVAAEIEWSKYLQTSLALLGGSLIGVLSAPSALGLAAAGCATTYVVLRTLHVFKKGFDLIERPEKFDAGARKYLTTAVAKMPLTPPDVLSQELSQLNKSLEDRLPRSSGSHDLRATLRLGDQFRATQLLSTEKRAVDVLVSEAEKLGYQLFLIRSSIPPYLPRGARDFLGVQRAGEAELSDRDAPSLEADELVEQAAIERLQRVFEASVTFGPSQWVEDFTRLPMLVQRHIATVLYDSIPREQPHDLTYGLDVLGQLVDEVHSTHGSAKPFDLDVFDWVYDIPLFVCNQIERAPHSKLLYTRGMVNFLRGRLLRWLPDSTLDNLSQAYIGLLAKLLRSFIGVDDSGAEYLTVVIREIPALTRSRRIETLVFIQRALILLLVESRQGKQLESKDRRLLIRTMAEVLRYSPGFDKDGAARAETIMSALAVTLYLSDGSDAYRVHAAEVIELLVSDRYSEIPFFELLSAIRRAAEVNERWKWSWWEMDQKVRGQAHFMSMDIWLTRAAIVALSTEAWRLSHLDDKDLPDQQVLSSMLRAIDSESEWINMLPESTAGGVRALARPLTALSQRRSEIVAARVYSAPLDNEKVKNFVQETMADVRAIFGDHNNWLKEVGAIRYQETVDESFQAGISRLLPREWFVPDQTLDIPIMLTGSRVGRALVDFELKKIINAMSSEGARLVEVPAASDSRIWDEILQMLDGGALRLLVLGVGVSEYDVYEEFSRVREASERRGAKIRFDTLRVSDVGVEGILIADPAKAFRVVRMQAMTQRETVYEEVLPLQDGGVACGISGITVEMQDEWLRDEQSNQDELRKRYSESVLDRTAWSFRVELTGIESSTFFRVADPASAAVEGGGGS